MLRLSLTFGWCSTLLAATTAFAAVPAGFQDSLVVDAIPGPTALAFTPDGRLLIARQAGVLRVFENNALVPTAALTLSGICSNSERGLLGVAVDPDFGGANQYVYLYYTSNASGTCRNRVSRFVLPGTSVIDLASERVLLDNIHSTAGNHNAGDLHFGKDGHLYVSVGDGGCDYAGDSGCAGSNDAARDRHTLVGKILRITREGGVPPDNPFLGSGTASCRFGDVPAGTICQETFAWGLRNPFRFAMDPGALGVRFFINDVGQGAREEIDLGQSGADYGWNCREGTRVNSTTGKCSPTPPALVDPIHEYAHGACGSVTGGAFLPTGFWPSGRDGSYYFSDYNCGTIFELLPSGGGFTRSDFATDLGASSAVHLVFGPKDGGIGLYYTTYQGGGEVRVIHFTGTGNRSPRAEVAATPTAGLVPLAVTFDATGSGDPDGDPLTYVWSFGDGSPEVETSALTIDHTYLSEGSFTAVLRARDDAGALSDPAAISIRPGNRAPTPVIATPPVSALFRVGESVTLTGSATDPDEGSLPDGSLTWNVLLHHDAHSHPFVTDAVGNGIVFTTPPPEDLAAAETSFLEIRLTATDSGGASTTVVQTFNPRRVAVSLLTSPSGLGLEIGGATFVAPATVTSWDGYALAVDAPDQSASGIDYTFMAWSDGGARSHTYVTPAAPEILGASFQALAPAPDAVPFLAVTSRDQSNQVEWVDPIGPSFASTTLVYRTNRFPTTPQDGTVLFTGGAPGGPGSFPHGGLANDTTYYYAAFVNRAGGGHSAGRFTRGRPFSTAATSTKWAYSTGASLLTPPSIGPLIIALSNDRLVHAVFPGATGGAGPTGFTRVLLDGVVQARSPIVPGDLVPGHSNLLFGAAQNGIVYAVDGDTGALVWQSGPLAQSFQAAVAGGFTQYGFPVDRLLLGTRNSTGTNFFYALDPATGVPVGAPYPGGEGGGLGPVSGGGSVDYATRRVFFASRAAGAGAHTLWCLEVTAGGFVHRWSSGVPGDVDGSPVVRGDRVYVGDAEGEVFAFDKMSGELEWSFDTGAEAINGFLFPDRTGTGLYFTTATRVIGLADGGTDASYLFPPRVVSSPSLVLFRPAEGGRPPRLYFGAGDQRLHELDLSQSPPTETSILLGGTPAVIGAPSYDTTNDFIYVGSDAGILYGIAASPP